MVELARSTGLANLVNFEMRFDPLRSRLRELVRDGAIGTPEHMSLTSHMAITRVPLRRYGWIFDAALGGGWAGAWGSHVIDMVRWVFDDVVTVTAEVRTGIDQRPDGDGVLRPCTAEDGFTAVLGTVSGVTATIDATSVASAHVPSNTVVLGSEGVLQVTADRVMQRYDSDGVHPVEVEGAAGGDLSGSMRRWAAVVADSVRDGTAAPGAPTFEDGLACRRVLDQMTKGRE